ncbi:MAG: F420-non-reducing hydrogenase iron-sulfur subunit D [Methanomassiliicoccales archaeon PtaU1.Bin124]|nr:MAG: F420-non-reducing hydrogenase iron-sulfur subunit D [Methanomassiliicoccales archaeon PtaU1.Bin124]
MKLVALTCSFCGYAATDLAGLQGMKYSSDVTIIRLPCTGRLDVKHVLQAVRMGADGVLVVGCLEGNCNYQYGNLEARKRVEQAKGIMKEIGLEPERVEMVNLASNQPWRFVQAVEDMYVKVERMGPSPLNKVRR